MYIINDNHIIYCFCDMERDREFFGPFFALLHGVTTWKIKILKNWKNVWRYYHFTHIWKSYDKWFLRYGVQQAADRWTDRKSDI